jgi:cell division GTPase FtsZ
LTTLRLSQNKKTERGAESFVALVNVAEKLVVLDLNKILTTADQADQVYKAMNQRDGWKMVCLSFDSDGK